jgi:3-methylfumaryl-CoA hydratase
MTEVDIDHLRTWIGREQHRTDTIAPRLVESFNAIFNVETTVKHGEPAPAGIHWCLAPDIAPMNGLGPDGHPARGGFLPPVPFPRRMWASGNLQFSAPFRVGDEVGKRSVIEDVVLKTGRSGALIFVTVRHDYETSRGLALRERQDIVYREQDSRPSAAPQADAEPPPADTTEIVEASAPLLFRYSAVTFNGHRIHYDFNYATQEEFYPGLIFHGPLQASYLLRLAIVRRNGALPDEFAFRAVKPLFAGGEITVNARDADAGTMLWIADQSGRTTMTASATGPSLA